eukprot:7255410-Lingulodinium_polyedra.AAC.1
MGRKTRRAGPGGRLGSHGRNGRRLAQPSCAAAALTAPCSKWPRKGYPARWATCTAHRTYTKLSALRACC